MKLVILLFAALALIIGGGVEAFRQQTVGVRGRLMCGIQPLKDTQVKLWNKNTLGRDDQLAELKTDEKGNFQISGGIGEILKMNVFFKIYHDCNDGIKPCQRKVQLGVPDDYVQRKDKVDKWFDAGTMNMEFVFPDEERHCW